jgi:hypothetical protein
MTAVTSIGIDAHQSGPVAPHWARHEHPDWCDPRLCGARHDLAFHHSEPLRATRDDDCTEITVGMVRVDVDDPGPVVRGETQVRLRTCDGFAGGGNTDVWLDAAGARKLAAALSEVADRVDREQTV